MKISKAMQQLGNYFFSVLLSLTTLTSSAQLFSTQEFYPGVKAIKIKSYNGTGGGGFWAFHQLDSLGRVKSKKLYRKKKLLTENYYEYNLRNDKVLDVLTTYSTSKAENPQITRYRYEYSTQGLISFQSYNIQERDSIVYEKIGELGDSVIKYKNTAYYYRTATGSFEEFINHYTLKYNSKKELVTVERYDTKGKAVEKTYFEYYDNGKLKRRKIARTQMPGVENQYTGGPGSDDMYYEYTYDNLGKVKNVYTIVNGKKWLLSKYNYR